MKIILVPPEKKVFLQEYSDGAYSPLSFFTAYTLLGISIL